MASKKRDKTEDYSGAPLDAFVRTRCRCGELIYFNRDEANKPIMCPKCDEEFSVRIGKDAQGRETIVATFSAKGRKTGPISRPATKSSAKPTFKPKVRVTEAPSIVPERPREHSRDGQFKLDMASDPFTHQKPAEATFEDAQFGSSEPAAKKSGPPMPYSNKRATVPGVMYTTCPCGEPQLVRRGDIGGKVQCTACRRKLVVDAKNDPQTKELVIKLRPV